MRQTAPAPAAAPVFAILAQLARNGGAALDRLFDWLLDGLDRYRQRRALRGMPEYLLKDMGLSRADAEQEAAKPFWTP